MGHFYYSQIGKVSIENVDQAIRELAEPLWGDKYIIKQSEGIPVSDEDSRIGQWAFWLPDWDLDCAFTMSFLNDGRMEFKVPRSKWDEYWEDQQSLRRKLVKHLKPASN